VCQRSLEDIASEGFDRRSIYPTLRRLLDAGLLSRQLGSGRSPNTYRLHLPPASAPR
jgi:DNA-binding PadR family transcriptional regulator